MSNSKTESSSIDITATDESAETSQENDDELEENRDTFIDEIKPRVLSRLALKESERMRLRDAMLLKDDQVALKHQLSPEKAKNIIEPKHEQLPRVPSEMIGSSTIIRAVTLANNSFSLASMRERVVEILKKAFLSNCRTKEAFLQVLQHCRNVIREYKIDTARSSMAECDSQQRTILEEMEQFQRDINAYLEKSTFGQNLRRIRFNDQAIDQLFMPIVSKHLLKTAIFSPQLFRAYQIWCLVAGDGLLCTLSISLTQLWSGISKMDAFIEDETIHVHEPVESRKEKVVSFFRKCFACLFFRFQNHGKDLANHQPKKEDEPCEEYITIMEFIKLYKAAANQNKGRISFASENFCKESEALDYNKIYEKALEDQDYWLADGIDSAFEKVVRKYGGGPSSIFTYPQ